MTLYALQAWLRYQMQAKRLHGIHSPFVYHLSELLVNNRDVKERFAEGTAYHPRYQATLALIAHHYQYGAPLIVGSVQDVISASLTVVNTHDVQLWMPILKAWLQQPGDERVIAFPRIHATPAHTASWKQLSAHVRIALSIDLFGAGLLWQKPTFLVKQEFLLGL